jgi:ATP adenylyltransferase
MDLLYAPWRTSYSSSIHEAKQENASADQCIFCQQLERPDDAAHFIFRRFKRVMVMLNLYPYNAGHLLILPLAHLSRLDELDKQTRADIMELTTHSTEILTRVLGAHGINVGLNLGKAAGAGIPAHLHMHVLPRWTGDTNFLPTLAHTKQISFDLQDMFARLKPAFDALPEL